jgi:hypothetical protein
VKRCLLVGLCFCAIGLACTPALRAAEKLVTVTPTETNEILANPGMGWQTFGVTRLHDKNLPDWIPSTVHYSRFGWNDLEPAQGKIDHALLDKILKETHDAGQRLALRVACCHPSPDSQRFPKWLADIGGRIVMADRYGRGGVPNPDMDDPIILERHLDFLKRLGQRYDSHPDIDHVDIGSVGWYGEWHQSGKNTRMPTMDNRLTIVKTYLSCFKKTPLLMLINGGECLRYATEHGAGWRGDCLGDLGGFNTRWNHMRNGYPVWLHNAGAEEAWRNAPVAWESCWDMQKWVKQGWSLRYIFNYALAYHASYLNNKSSPLPERDDVRPETERFLQRLGYRLVLKEMSHPAEVRPGEAWTLAMKWQNTGSAPCYRPYRLAYRLADGQGHAKTIVSPIAVNRWMPGSVDVSSKTFLDNPPDLPNGDIVAVSDSVTIPADLPAGEYSLSLAVVEGDPPQPVVRLAIQGRAADGWYLLSKIDVRKR